MRARAGAQLCRPAPETISLIYFHNLQIVNLLLASGKDTGTETGNETTDEEIPSLQSGGKVYFLPAQRVSGLLWGLLRNTFPAT